jgi:ATP-dependent Clp protease ATP-binding subunit ClpC
MFERFTEDARRAVVAAQEESRLLGHNHIGSEHLLLGLLYVRDGTAARVLENAGVTVEAARAQVADLAGPSEKSPTGHIPFTRRAKKILELSLREALEQKRSYIGTEHILQALTRDSEGMGARVLERLGVPLPELRRQVLEEAGTAAPGPAAPEEAGHRLWAADWRYAQASAREGRVPPQTVIGYRGMLTPIDRRLAAIERHLGIATDEAPAPGFRGLLDSVERRLANIERHVERHVGGDAGQAGEKAEQADEETGPAGPAASPE